MSTVYRQKIGLADSRTAHPRRDSTRAATPAHVGASRQGLTRILSGTTFPLDVTTDSIEESPLRTNIKRLCWQNLKQPLHTCLADSPSTHAVTRLAPPHPQDQT
ncbi:MAG: hypothetical protein IPJ46_09155 [Anaerolineales bacterium]|nr:hypothetical protein [Anaerolineales bacterium]